MPSALALALPITATLAGGLLAGGNVIASSSPCGPVGPVGSVRAGQNRNSLPQFGKGSLRSGPVVP
jgi:hypothetical protein